MHRTPRTAVGLVVVPGVRLATTAPAEIEALDERALSAPGTRSAASSVRGRARADRAPRAVAARLGRTALLATGLVAVALGTSCSPGRPTATAVPPVTTEPSGPPAAPAAKAEPRCGDGTCDSVEACGVCVADCGACTPGLGAACASDSACSQAWCSNGRCSPRGFAYIPAGAFTMGSPDGSDPGVPEEPGREDYETQHNVTLTGAFWVSTTEVTQDQWRSLMNTSPSYFADCGGACPVEQVSWLDAVGYANALSASEGLAACYSSTGEVVGGPTVYDCAGYRLPTEAEWEYAARGGTTGATYGAHAQVAWTVGSSAYLAHPVGALTANAYGVYDMLGNVSEWTNDGYGDYPSGSTTDPTGASHASTRVIRGGSWSDEDRFARAANRDFDEPGFVSSAVGFRLVRSAP